MIKLGRTDRGLVAQWWWTVDRWLLAAIVLLVVVGAVLALAASPAIAMKLGLPRLHFVYRQSLFLAPALVLLLAVSMMTTRQVRRLALGLFILAFGATVLTLFIGFEAKGSARWLSVFGFSVQPSEFLKPAFVVVIAWIFALGAQQRTPVSVLVSLTLLASVIGVLVLQPDIGQAGLAGLVWGALFFLAGVHWIWVGALGGAGVAGGLAAYAFVPHVTSRVDRFLDPSSGDTYQVDRALDAFRSGGLWGRGPGEGEVKHVLPDAHTDYIFAVAGEEFGIVVCLVIVALFAFIVVRGLARAHEETDPFVQLSVAGLTILFGLQALINLAVNLNLMPPKGMTLPFLSYGGSSLVALSLTMGMLLALTRRRPGATTTDRFATLQVVPA